jgi:hypothetical protein
MILLCSGLCGTAVGPEFSRTAATARNSLRGNLGIPKTNRLRMGTDQAATNYAKRWDQRAPASQRSTRNE